MTQERMHPDDLRAIMAAIVAAPKGWVGPLPEAIDRLLADLARTAKPEDEPEFLAWRQKAWDNASRAEKAEDRANEMYNRLVIAESWMNDAALGLGEKRNRRIAELEQWQWDNMKKWLGIIGWGSMTPTQPECPTLIDAALQQGVEDAKRVDTLEARVKELEEAIKKHRSIVKGSQHWRGCDWDEDLWSKVK